MALTDRTTLKLHTHQSLELKCIERGSPYRIVIAIGGIRSGKSLCIALWMLLRGLWDTAQMHGIFANTKGQLDSILADVMPWIEAAGILWQAHRKPPPEWIAEWVRRGIPTPPRRASYRGILILSSGFHCQMGSLENRAYTKFKGAKYGSVVIEEVTSGATEQAVRYIFERVNCGLGPEKCAALHHHVKILHANPPDEDTHWIYEWLARQEARVAKEAGLPANETGDSYPCLLRGIGDAIYIPSRTIDNAENLPATFAEDMAGTLDTETRDKVLGGALTRKKTGRAYNKFDQSNEWEVTYDQNRTIFLFFDFNNNPTVAGLAHPLIEGEYPSELSVGVQPIGVFGEFFHVGGMDAHELALRLARGEASSGGYLPPSWQGVAKHKGPVVVFGDAKGGGKRSMTGVTPWSIVHEVLREACTNPVTKVCRYRIRVGTENPLEQIKIRSLNAGFSDTHGRHRIYVDPHCRELIIDLLTNITNPDGTIKKPGGPRPGSKFWQRTHLSDALAYLAHEMFPMGQEPDPRGNVPKVIRREKRETIPSFLPL